MKYLWAIYKIIDSAFEGELQHLSVVVVYLIAVQVLLGIISS